MISNSVLSIQAKTRTCHSLNSVDWGRLSELIFAAMFNASQHA